MESSGNFSRRGAHQVLSVSNGGGVRLMRIVILADLGCMAY